MPRNRHKKKSKKISVPGNQRPADKLSPVSQVVTSQLNSAEPEFLLDNLIRVMTDSAELAEEPEFIDLYLDGNRAAEVTERWAKKYVKRLEKAERQSPDEYQQLFDEVRIKIIDELATPAFRQEVTKRLQAMYDRLTVAKDPEKLELVLLLQALLSMKETPWGVCGLILNIYTRSLTQKLQAHETELELITALEAAIKEEGEKKLSLAMLLKSPDKLEQVAQKIFGKNPGLRELAEKRALDIADQFEDLLVKGEVPLELFTEEELLLPFKRLQEAYGMPITEVTQTEERRQKIYDAIMQAIKDIMTPERYQRFRQDIASTVKVWMGERQKWAYVLELELDWLEDTFEIDAFIISAYIGQMRRAGKASSKAAH